MGFIGDIQTRVLRLWLWFKVQVTNRKAEPYLAALSFFESFLFAIPIDALLAAMVLADRARWKAIAFLATATSTLGAAAGYLIGFFAFDLVKDWFFGLTAASEFLSKVVTAFDTHAITLTFAAGLTPLPNGPVVVAAGFIGTNFFWFLLSWTFARALRFFGVAYIVYAFGADTLSRSERILNIGTALITLVIIGWVVWAAAGI